LKLSLDIYGELPFNSISYDASNQPYIDEVKESEKTRTALGAGAGLNVELNGFIFQTGIGSFLLKTDFTSSESTISVDTSGSHYNYTDSSFIVFDSSCTCTTSVTIHIDSTWISAHDTIVTKQPVTATNQVSYLTLPFLIGYRFSIGKLDLEIKAGTSISMLNTVKAKLISPVDGTIENYGDKSNSPFRKSYWSIIGSAAIHYNLSNRLSVFVQPAMKYGLNSIYKDNYPLTKKINSNSVVLGLRIHFLKNNLVKRATIKHSCVL
jgi:hypothetical protein